MPRNTDRYRANVGKRIRRARRAAKLSQSDLAEKIGLESQTISRLERGVLGPSVLSLFAIAEVCDVSSDWLATGKLANRGIPARVRS